MANDERGIDRWGKLEGFIGEGLLVLTRLPSKLTDSMDQSVQRASVNGLTLFIFILLIILPGLSLRSADWTDHLKILTTIGIVGALSGAALALSVFKNRIAGLLNAVYGTFFIVLQLGITLDPALTWRDRIISLAGRTGSLILSIFQNRPNEDPLFFLLISGILFWLMASIGAWLLFRKNGLWSAVLPPGAVLLMNETVYLGSTKLAGYLIAYVFFVLVLATRVDIKRRQKYWHQIRAKVPPNLIFHFSRAGLTVTLLLMLIAWGGPVFAQSEQVAQVWGIITLPINNLQNIFSDLFGGLRGAAGITYDIYGDTLELRAGVEPEDLLMMEITPERLPSNATRFYWYSRAYNVYEDGNWKMTIAQTANFEPAKGNLPLPEYAAREAINATFAPMVPSIHAMVVPDSPIWVNRSGEIDFYPLENGTIDVIRLTANGLIRSGETYEARASIAIPTALELRQAGEVYPDWVMDNYLQITDQITGRTRQLALSITEGIENPYDKAAAITRWLRENIAYSRVTEPPPVDAESIDWFLFDYNIGFCNWYATAEVVLLRALGIPSRMSVGYARGLYHAAEGYYEVRGGDAHAWPEVYFPAYGWVEFEPTGNQSPLIRPQGTDESDNSSSVDSTPAALFDEGEGFDPNLSDQFPVADFGVESGIKPTTLLYTFIVLAIVTLAGIGIWFRFDPVTRASVFAGVAAGLQRIGIKLPKVLFPLRAYEITEIGKIYSRWSLWLGRLGIELTITQTPHERALAFASAYPQASARGWIIVQSYVHERFGKGPKDASSTREAWSKLRPFLLSEWMKHKIQPKGPNASSRQSFLYK